MTIQTSDASTINSGIIPMWIKNNIIDWANGTSSDDEFISSISYLIDHGVIQT
jgi:hypothetical protein